MNVLFLSISALPHADEHSISLDLIREFTKNGHTVYIVCAADKKSASTTVSDEAGCKVLRVKIGGNKKARVIRKGLTTVSLPHLYIRAIKRYFSGVTFDLVLYPTPPVTHVRTAEYIKKRDGAVTYLLLKDIFPQNAVDIGMMSKTGAKGGLYRYFKRREKKLYEISDHIGCMSEANVRYVLTHNSGLSPRKVEICPNSIEYMDMSLAESDRTAVRNTYGLPQDKKIFVYGGNLGKPQGIPFVIDCLRAEKDNGEVFFLIVGDGTEYRRLEAFIADEKPQNVKLIRRLPKEEYDRLAASCDVGLIFLDHRFTIPNFPSRLLSYMQAGLPVLACTDPVTDVGKVILDGGFGWQCESNDVEAFKKAVERAGKECGAPFMKEKEQAYLAEHYTAEKSFQTIMNAYNACRSR